MVKSNSTYSSLFQPLFRMEVFSKLAKRSVFNYIWHKKKCFWWAEILPEKPTRVNWKLRPKYWSMIDNGNTALVPKPTNFQCRTSYGFWVGWQYRIEPTIVLTLSLFQPLSISKSDNDSLWFSKSNNNVLDLDDLYRSTSDPLSLDRQWLIPIYFAKLGIRWFVYRLRRIRNDNWIYGIDHVGSAAGSNQHGWQPWKC